jgi:hypothetical protein
MVMKGAILLILFGPVVVTLVTMICKLANLP